MSYRLTKEAEEDIIKIADFGIRAFGERQARRYHQELFNTFELISQFPRIARERSEITPPVRIHPYKAHLIVYLVESDDVLILRIRHGHEEWAADDS